jgi:hypothetical protein
MPGTGKSQCAEEILYQLCKLRKLNSGFFVSKINSRNVSTVTSGLVDWAASMGRVLGLNFDAPSIDVIKALRAHLSHYPYVHWRCMVFFSYNSF